MDAIARTARVLEKRITDSLDAGNVVQKLSEHEKEKLRLWLFGLANLKHSAFASNITSLYQSIGSTYLGSKSTRPEANHCSISSLTTVFAIPPSRIVILRYSNKETFQALCLDNDSASPVPEQDIVDQQQKEIGHESLKRKREIAIVKPRKKCLNPSTKQWKSVKPPAKGTFSGQDTALELLYTTQPDDFSCSCNATDQGADAEELHYLTDISDSLRMRPIAGPVAVRSTLQSAVESVRLELLDGSQPRTACSSDTRFDLRNELNKVCGIHSSCSLLCLGSVLITTNDVKSSLAAQGDSSHDWLPFQCPCARRASSGSESLHFRLDKNEVVESHSIEIVTRTLHIFCVV